MNTRVWPEYRKAILKKWQELHHLSDKLLLYTPPERLTEHLPQIVDLLHKCVHWILEEEVARKRQRNPSG